MVKENVLVEELFKPLIFKDFKESACFSDVDASVSGGVNFVKFNISSSGEFFFIVGDSLNLDVFVEEGVSFDLSLFFDKSSSFSLNVHLAKGSFFRVSCLSNNSFNANFSASCGVSSKFEVVNFCVSELFSSSNIILEEDASCVVSSNFFNLNKKSRVKDVVVHRGVRSNSLIRANGYLVSSLSDFRGLIKIEPSAFDAQGFQESNFLLEQGSKAISVPDLEILNNEVKCSHGSTISRIKDEDLFYFESRGIDKDFARLMLVEGFLLANVSNNKIKSFAENMLRGVFDER